MSNINTDEIQNVVKASSASIIDFRKTVLSFIQNGFADFANGSNLDSIGRSRNLPRLSGELDAPYRARILNAWEANAGAGDVGNLIAVIESCGYKFNSFIQGDTSGGEGSFNLIVASLGTNRHNSAHTRDGSIYYDAPYDNSFTVEINQLAPISASQKQLLNEAIDSVKRASSKNPYYVKI